MKIGVNEGELSILQHSFLLGTDALDIEETALKLGSHGQKNKALPVENADSTEESRKFEKMCQV